MKQQSICCVLNGDKIEDMPSFYRELGEQLPLPSHFGKNLDALWDFLSTDLAKPLTIHWRQSEESQFSLGDQFDQITDLFDRLIQERDDFHYFLE